MMSSFTLQPVDPMTGRLLGPPRTVAVPLLLSSSPDLQAVVPVADGEPYPDEGTVDAVLAWVGYDPDRAKAAIVAEHGRGKPRKTLLAELSERTG